MIRIHRTWWNGERRREYAARTCIVCDICGAEGPPEFGDTEFDIGMARARSAFAGFVEYLDGRITRSACAACAARRQAS